MNTPSPRLAAVLLALTLLAAACAAEGVPAPTSSASPTPPLTVAPTSAPSGTPIAVPQVFWQPGSVPAAQDGSAIIGIVPRPGGGYVAVGYDGVFGSIAWTSSDGTSWTEVPLPEGWESAGISRVMPFSGGLLALGRDTGDIETDLAAAWISTDGTDWRRVEGGPDMQGQLLDAVETDDGRLIAVGGVPGADTAAVWISTDAGETWQRSGEMIENAFMWSIAEGGPGFVAVGWRRDPQPTMAVWTSADGESWTLAPDPADSLGFEGMDIIEEDGTLVMVGSLVQGGEGRIWTSEDGLDWEAADDAADFTDVHFSSVASTQFGLVAVGSRGMDATAFVSTDGGRRWTTWGNVVPGAVFNAVIATPEGGYIVGGRTQEGTLETGISGAALAWSAVAAR
jgi:hypothetical protein